MDAGIFTYNICQSLQRTWSKGKTGHNPWLEINTPWVNPPSAAVHFKKKVYFLLSSSVCHHYFNLVHMSGCLQSPSYLSGTGFDFCHMVQMKNFHRRKSKWEVQRNNLGKERICECIHWLQHSAHSRKSRNSNSPSSSAAINTPDWFSSSRLFLAQKGDGNVQMSLWGSPLAFTDWVPAVFVCIQLLTQSENYTKCNYHK